MNDERLAELKEKYKDRNLLEELAWGIYANHSGYTSKQSGEFLNWLCLMAYDALKEKPQGEWIKVKEERMSIDMSGEIVTQYKCSMCGRVIATLPGKLADYYPFCHCGAKMGGDAE